MINELQAGIMMTTRLTSDEIKALRQRLGMSIDAMAHAVGCSTGAIRAWEAGTRRPAALTYIRKLRMLGRRVGRYNAAQTDEEP